MALNYLITGTSRGIGLEMTKQLLAKGYTVFAVARNPDKADALQRLKHDYSEQLKIFKADVNSDEQVASLARDLGAETRLDVLINNAGVYGSGGTFEGQSLKDVEQTLLNNAVSPMRVTRALLPQLKNSTSAKVVHITSLMGSIGDNTSGGAYGYRMSKAALNMFHKTFAVEYPAITSLTIHPGWVRTDMGGSEAPTEVDGSARGILAVIERATNGDSGKFFDYEGDVLPW